MERNWFVVALLTAALAVLLDLLGHIVVFQQGISEPMPPVIYWIVKFAAVFVVFFLGTLFLKGFRVGIFLAIVATLLFGVIWEFSVVEYSYSIVLHLFHLPAIFVAWVFAWFLGKTLPGRALFLIFLAVLVATTVAITVLSLVQGPTVPY